MNLLRNAFPILGLIAAGAIDLGAQQPKGTLGIEAAGRGGVVIACRHGITDSADEDEKTLRYDDPSTQRRLSAEGERQAVDIGKAFRALRIPPGEVIVSPMQRARRTGELAFGEVRLDSIWHTRGEDYSGPNRKLRAEVLGRPVEKGNRIIVSHIGTLYSVLPSIQGELEEGDCAVIRPRGGTEYDVIEVVPWRAWLHAAGRTDRDTGPERSQLLLQLTPVRRFASPLERASHARLEAGVAAGDGRTVGVRGAVIGAIVGAGFGAYFVAATCDVENCLSHPDTRTIMMAGVAIGAVGGFLLDHLWHVARNREGGPADPSLRSR